ncbi:polysaccharide deacetylase family protein [Clostridium lacusfryxellense]|uniref:polysaccharide deacetylase family protein n=1 Tax=Clostridium lacusfryxellense TaxID=205328 RepID=UPI001C0B0DD4|nr:polysaccharide deacetylase family protein [Clostridium lacusfryxellense]MBU3111291.1 polysaccharide deacetylase family protein [Clostridium lacusfryxellense]
MANIFLRFPGGRPKALTLSYDDGVEQDIKLIKIMNEHGLKGTFNLNSGLYADEGTIYQEGQIHRRMTKNQVTETYLNAGHEVAVHGLTHPFLEQLPTHMVVNEIIKDRENLETQFSTIIRGMAYPFGTNSEDVIKALKSCGIAYARTVISTNDFRIPTDWLRLTATCHHDSPELKSLAKKFVEDKLTQTPYLFYLWGHSYEFEADNNWNVIEDFAKYTGNREDIWYATNIEIYEYIDAYNRLIFSVDGKRVENPTNKKIWFQYEEKHIEIQPGKMIVIYD